MVTSNAGKPTQFGLLFKDAQQNVLSDVTYSIKASQGNTTVAQNSDQHTPDGTGIQTIIFPKSVPANLYISVDTVAGAPSGEFVGSATFKLVVS